jgi:hypothetical protein
MELKLRPWPITLWILYGHYRRLQMGRLEALRWAASNTYAARACRKNETAQVATPCPHGHQDWDECPVCSH